ncbi:MAG: respiratory nitrate reductase subunit gamma [Brevundimonas sp.]|uniref:Respiratory nitrate reductase subunit gamma n=1 Tax=Brevundimonas albigilva TaxID=1312364 RepID=A0ABY4SMT6_9CAUL|nr:MULTISPECIES: respiratory nitrate reductase subunit gamma [Brevundimonas]MCV0416552.1 respiratory nitrate reductase subunit gamma [Brevundimonas sp.]URI15016.1 respiratory nitrate reductase subunit gamma [Brevundimonas albigilva]
MEGFLNQLAFGWFPYLAVTVLIVGSILRFDKAQYSWRSQSSQFLRRKQMLIGSNLFHLGILALLGGHFVGLLTPINVFDYFGIGHGFKQMMALVVGGIAGVAAFIGASLLLHRRLFDARIRRSSSKMDILVLFLLWLQLALGLATTWWTMKHLDGSEMVLFMGWANGLLTFNPAAADLIINAYWVYKLHIVLGLTIFLITPFTRLVHVWSIPIMFLVRPGYQLVRSRGPVKRPTTTPTHGEPGSAPTYGGPSVIRGEAESAQ